MSNGKNISNNHEILFVYDAKMCNPNGDPDNENKPRMDVDREINLVSDLRLKRYIRDYIEQYLKKTIFVCNIDGRVVNATERLNHLAQQKKVKLEDLLDDDLLSELVDVRFFGATMPIKGEKNKPGSSRKFIGPVQFNWGYSLNKVTLVDSNGITSHFSSESEKTQGAMGKDYRVDYSLIAFHGIISAKRAEKTNLTDDDIGLLDKAIINSIPLMATRTKIGQYPRLYLRIEYNSPEYLLGDLRKYVTIDSDAKSPVRFVTDYKMDLSELKKFLDNNKGKIQKINWWVHKDLQIKDVKDGNLGSLLTGLEGKLAPIMVS